MTRRALWLCLSLLAACMSTCDGPEVLAELSAFHGGEIERDEASTQGRWIQAQLGARFRVGDGLRTGQSSSADLALLPSGSAHVAPRSLVRFLATAPSYPRRQVALETGEVEVLAEQIDLEIHTPRAVARVTRGSKVKLTMRDGHERFDLLVGRVVVAHAGVERTIEKEGTLDLDLQTGILTAVTPDSADAALPTHDAGTAEDAAADALVSDAAPAAEDAGKQALSPAPERAASLRLRAIETATIHLTEAPLDVFLPITECATKPDLRVDGELLESTESGALARIGFGSHRVRLSCAELKREIKLVLKRDAARLELPKRAQSVRVEADGRRYTVRYQNLLPDLTFVWPGESEEGAFKLVLRSGKRELTRSFERPEGVLSGAALGEGEHKFWFRAPSGRSSKPTTLRLAFDNTARSAYLSLPVEGGAVNEGAVAVEGAALVASKVEVEGTPAQIDAQGRFRELVTLPAGQRAVSVRVEHPSSGVHYYLRRLR